MTNRLDRFCRTSLFASFPATPHPTPLRGGGAATATPHLPHLATPHPYKCGNTPSKWELSLPYAFRRRDMLVGSVAIFLAGSWVRRLAIAQCLDRSAAARFRLAPDK